MMKPIKHDDFIQLIKEANIICLPGYGVFYNTKGINPTTKRKFEVQENFTFHSKRFPNGMMLIAKDNEETKLIGFVLREIFEWVH